MNKEFFMKNKKKNIIVVAVIAVSLIGFSLLNSTYSLFYHEDTSKNTEGYTTGTLSITASSKGSTISLSDALPVEDSVGSASTPYTFTVTNTGNLNYKFNIKLLSTGSSSTTIGSQYIKLKVDDGSVTTLSSLSNGIIKKDVTLAAGESVDISVRVWLSISTPNSQIGKTFNSKIVIDGQAVYTETENVSTAANDTLKLLSSFNGDITLATDTPDFSNVSGDYGILLDGSTVDGDGTMGLYKSLDDIGITYYFRGNVENNYVSFADKYWRIIRINGDGSIRLLYAGTEAHENGYDDSSNLDTQIFNASYNSNTNDNTYVGYMYGTAGASTYSETHSNSIDNPIKRTLETWYEETVYSYNEYIVDTIYCNDRTPVDVDFNNNVFSGTGVGSEDTAYASFKRNFVDYTPNFKCNNINDRFTVNTSTGNGKLTYPIGLITADEVVYAGTSSAASFENAIFNQTNYLYNNIDYLTMSPAIYNSGAEVAYYSYHGILGSTATSGERYIRPVISIKGDAITGGLGVMEEPFIVG